MLNNEMLFGNSLAPGWRKIIVTPDQYENKNRYYTAGYSSGEIKFWGRYWNFFNSYLSNNKLEDGTTIKAIYSGTTIETDYSGEVSRNYYVSYSQLILDKSFGDNDLIYIKKGKDGKLFTFRGGNAGLEITHRSASSKPSSSPADSLFLPEDRNKVLDIYIGLTPPPKKQKKTLRKKAQKGLLISLSRSFCAFFL